MLVKVGEHPRESKVDQCSRSLKVQVWHHPGIGRWFQHGQSSHCCNFKGIRRNHEAGIYGIELAGMDPNCIHAGPPGETLIAAS